MRAGKEFWLLNQGHKLEFILFCLFLFFIPTQLGLHFWPAFSSVSGIRIDYLSPTFYITDLLLISLFFLKILQRDFKFPEIKLTPQIFLVSSFLIIVFFQGKYIYLSLYGLIKLIEYFLFFRYISTTKFLYKKSLLSMGILFSSLCFQVGLALLQYMNKGSIGHMFYFFGERFFTAQTPGIAQASINGALILRPYATFPHPNVYAGYILTIGSLLLFWYPFSTKLSLFWYRFLIAILLGGLLISFSRTPFFVYIGILGVLLVKNKQRKYMFFLAFVCVSILIVFPQFFQRLISLFIIDQSYTTRKALFDATLLMIGKHPLGVGILHFLPTLPSFLNIGKTFFLQPVHSIYMLIFAEYGVIGGGIFSFFAYKTLKRLLQVKNFVYQTPFISFVCILLLGLIDHYFLTLQQGQLLFCFILGLCYNRYNGRA